MRLFNISYLLCILYTHFSTTSSTICGPDALPYKFSAYSDDYVEIECYKPTCFDTPNNNQYNRYFFRSFSNMHELQNIQENEENYHLNVNECHQISLHQSCPLDTQRFSEEIETTPQSFIICCQIEHANFTHDNNVTVAIGYEIIGGNVFYQKRQIGFDYLSDITKTKSNNNEITYQVRTRRLYCPSQIFGPRNQVSFARAFAAPISEVQTLQEGEQARAAGDPTIVLANGHDVLIQPDPSRTIYNENPTYIYAEKDDIVIIDPPKQQWYQYYQYYPTSSLYCFSGDSVVTLVDGTVKRMDTIQIGDWVMSRQDSEIVYSQVKSWLHKLPNQEASFIKMTLSDGTSLKITPQHLIYKTECTAHEKFAEKDVFSAIAAPSEEVNIGDCLYKPDEETNHFIQARVENIEIVNETGIYAPLTEFGDIVVNKVLASCFSVTQDLTIQSNFFRVTNYFNEISESVFGRNNQQDEVDLLLSSQTLLEIMSVLLPSF